LNAALQGGDVASNVSTEALIRAIRGRFSCWSKKKTGLVGPASRGVELRCGYITAQRELT